MIYYNACRHWSGNSLNERITAIFADCIRDGYKTTNSVDWFVVTTSTTWTQYSLIIRVILFAGVEFPRKFETVCHGFVNRCSIAKVLDETENTTFNSRNSLQLTSFRPMLHDVYVMFRRIWHRKARTP